MPTMERRQFLKLSAAMGAALAWGGTFGHPSKSGWCEQRDREKGT